MARSYGVAASFGCYLASIRYVRLPSYLQFLFISNTLILVSGTGLMCMSSQKNTLSPHFVDDYFIDINNVGSMSQCLYAYNNPNYDDVVGSGWQAAQVSTISIMNFSGRIFIGKYIFSFILSLYSFYTGLISDFTKNKYGMPRSYCLILVAVIFFISQVATSIINDIAHLWIASALVGLAYGSAFSLLPTVCVEWFGLRKCGLLSLFKILNAVSYQRTSLRTWVTSLCHLLWLVTSSLFYSGGTLMRTRVHRIHPTMRY